MKNNVMINAPDYLAEQEQKYNEIAGVAFVNLYTLSKDEEVIALSPFNHKDIEHLFLLNVAKGLGGVTQKSVAIDASPLVIRKLNRGLTSECRYERLKHDSPAKRINPDAVLEFMRKWAAELMNEDEDDFDYGRIYYAFYAKQKGKTE